MKTLIPVDQAGRLVLPKAMRESLQLRGKGMVAATLAGNRVELESVVPKPLPIKKAGRFLIVKATGKTFDAVAALKASIDELSPRERCELNALLRGWDEDGWDSEMASDAEAGGKLDKLRIAAEVDVQAGRLRDFPQPAKA